MLKNVVTRISRRTKWNIQGKIKLLAFEKTYFLFIEGKLPVEGYRFRKLVFDDFFKTNKSAIKLFKEKPYL